MTIALGILAKDGVVIAADTEESIGSMKVPTLKIFSRIDPGRRAFSATGAGHASYIDAISQRLAKAFENARGQEDAERLMAKDLVAFYADHGVPMHTLPEEERPGAAVMIGMTWKSHDPVLLATDYGLIHRCKGYAAVGSGAQHALMLLDRIIPKKDDIPLALAGALAAYTIFHVKEYVQGCGKKTHVTMLQNGQGEYFSEHAIALMEENFRLYLQFDAAAVSYVLGRSLRNEKEEGGRLIAKIQKLRQQAQALPHSKYEAGRDLDWSDTVRSVSTGRWIEEIKGRAVIKRSPSRRRKNP